MMPRSGSFERRLLLALVLFSVVPSLLLIGAGAYVLREVVALQTSAAAFERIGETGRALLEAAEGSGEPRLVSTADRHREVLSTALLQARRWEYLNQRALQLIPLLGIVLAGALLTLAVRAARGMARELARPVHELVGWAGRVAKEEPLPPARPEDLRVPGELAVLREAFRAMAGELAASRARALEAERTRSWVAMARSVAHELKNALTPLRLAVRSLEREVTSDAAREPLEVLTSEAERLEELARAFSQFGRLPEGPASEIDLREQLRYLLRTHLPPQVEHRIHAPEHLPPVIGHHEVLSRAFANIVLNAAEAIGPDGGCIEVEMVERAGAVEVVIRDSGPGISGGDLERIWDPDYTTKARGTGLGLALVKQSVQAHGGTVRVRNRPGSGAEFSVLLPLTRTTATP